MLYYAYRVLYSTVINIQLKVLTAIRQKRTARDGLSRYFTGITSEPKLAVCSVNKEDKEGTQKRGTRGIYGHDRV